jgi:hypothetical protein
MHSAPRLTEEEGCAILLAAFQEAGFSIEENFRFQEQGLDIGLDGFDPQRRVGYEFITTQAGDREELTPEVLTALEARLEKGELILLLVDEADVDPARLRRVAQQFLERARQASS